MERWCDYEHEPRTCESRVYWVVTEQEIAAQAETAREQIAQLTERLDELGRATEDVRITAAEDPARE
nr:hypothetical protein [Kutzneria buriramensis]WKX06770.1 hypothetical protein Q4V64_04375 [Kutzneria buriramensis]